MRADLLCSRIKASEHTTVRVDVPYFTDNRNDLFLCLLLLQSSIP